MGRDEEDFDDLIENVAIATVGDVMDLEGENRILVREGPVSYTHLDVYKRQVVPNASVNDKTPETGDSTNMTLWILLVMVSGISVFGVYRRKRQINQHKR